MATSRSFEAMLSEYLTFDLLKEEFFKRDYFLNKVEKDNGWKGGSVPVPFIAGRPSSVSFGGLVPEDDISELTAIKGKVDSPKEIWGSLLFHHRDILEHDGRVNEKSFLNVMRDTVDGFVEHMKAVVSVNLLNGAWYSRVVGAGQANGVIEVANPDRFTLDQAVFVMDSNSPAVKGYVRNIDVGAHTITLYSARQDAVPAGVPVDLTAFAAAQGAKIYLQGQATDGLTSLREILLSPANGGGTTVYGESKVAYPYLQAQNISGTGISATNVLDKIFDALMEVQRFGKGKTQDVIMSYKHWGSIMKILEGYKGSYNVVPNSTKTSVYGWSEIQVGGVKGSVNLVAVQDLDDDVMYMLDYRGLKLLSNGFFRKRVSPDGNSFYEIRGVDGYKYVQDWCFFGEFICSSPSRQAAIVGISY